LILMPSISPPLLKNTSHSSKSKFPENDSLQMYTSPFFYFYPIELYFNATIQVNEWGYIYFAKVKNLLRKSPTFFFKPLTNNNER
jgi:hypothetical protein